jgi:uncharacterized iron-regulated membrane protein
VQICFPDIVMLTPEDRQIGAALWVASGILAAIVGGCLYWSRLPPSRYGVVRRGEQPGMFWFGIGLYGLMFVAVTWTALYFTLPEPGPW